MRALDVAGLVVVAGRALGIGTDAALAQLDIPAAQAALAEATPPSAPPGPAAAAAAWAALVAALLRHPPFPGHRQHLAAAAGLQFLAINGWQASLDPPAAAIVIEALDSGQLAPASAASWLTPRLSPHATPRPRHKPPRALRNRLRLLSPLPGPGTAGMTVSGHMLARFTDPAIAAIHSAQHEARRLGHDHLDPEHLLLGLISQHENIAVQALNLLGVSLPDLRQQLHNSLGHSQQTPAGPIHPSHPRGQKTLNSALPEALTLPGTHTDPDGCIHMGTEHLLLAQFHDNGPAAQALTHLGAGEHHLRRAVTTVLAAAGPAPRQTTPHRQRPRRPTQARKAEHLQQQAGHLQQEVARLQELLLRHGIDPHETDHRSA